jgi:hypothetical protein
MPQGSPRKHGDGAAWPPTVAAVWAAASRTDRQSNSQCHTHLRQEHRGSEAPQRFPIEVVPRYTPEARETCLEALHSSAEGDTDWGVATGGLLHVSGVPLAPESTSTLQLQRAKLPDAVVFATF